MNSLGRKINQNEVVVLKRKMFKSEYQALEQRLFRVKAGFGMDMFTSGTALAGAFLDDSELARFEGTDIDKGETEKYQGENANPNL